MVQLDFVCCGTIFCLVIQLVYLIGSPLTVPGTSVIIVMPHDPSRTSGSLDAADVQKTKPTTKTLITNNLFSVFSFNACISESIPCTLKYLMFNSEKIQNSSSITYYSLFSGSLHSS